MLEKVSKPQGRVYIAEWREFRRLSQEKLAELIGTTKGTISKKENEPEKVDVAWLSRIAGGLNITATDLFFRPAPSEADKDGPTISSVPFLSWVSAGNLRKADGVTSADIERYVPVANLPRGDWVALKVEGDSMDRIAPDQSVIIVNRADDTLVDSRFYVFVLEGGDATFKQFRRQPRPVLRPFSSNLDHLATPVEDDEFFVFGRVRRVITDL